MEERINRELTPWKRLAIVAHRLMMRVARVANQGENKYRIYAPDIADFEKEFELYYQRDLLELEKLYLENYDKLARVARLIEVNRKLSALKFAIAKRENPDEPRTD
jgi:hypothetical protein